MADTSIPSLRDRLARIKQSRGDHVLVDEIGALVSSVTERMQGDIDAAQLTLGPEIREMLDFIAAARSELTAMRPNSLTTRDIPAARDELDAVIAHTEHSAGRIMDVADRMADLAGSMENEAAAEVVALSTEIYEASSFQDIIGQRVSKVVTVLKTLEERLSNLATAVGDTDADDEKTQIFDGMGEVVNADALKHGPQLEGRGNSQDDIDALLASFD